MEVEPNEIFLLGLFNLVCLFVLGWQTFLDFAGAASRALSDLKLMGTVNHSIKSYATFMSEYLPSGMQISPGLIQAIIALTFGTVIICIGVVLLTLYRYKLGGDNPYLFLSCTIAALVLPTESQDYTLPLLAPAMALFFLNLRDVGGSPISRVCQVLLIILMSLAYSSTLYSAQYKPFFLHNNLPALMLILISSTLLLLMRSPRLVHFPKFNQNQVPVGTVPDAV